VTPNPRSDRDPVQVTLNHIKAIELLADKLELNPFDAIMLRRVHDIVSSFYGDP
jgi:hypothetical protein